MERVRQPLSTGILERRSPFCYTTPDPRAVVDWLVARSWQPHPPTDADGTSELARLTRDGKTVVIYTSGLVVDLGDAVAQEVG